jgi:hypothetical protein
MFKYFQSIKNFLFFCLSICVGMHATAYAFEIKSTFFYNGIKSDRAQSLIYNLVPSDYNHRRRSEETQGHPRQATPTAKLNWMVNSYRSSREDLGFYPTKVFSLMNDWSVDPRSSSGRLAMSKLNLCFSGAGNVPVVVRIKLNRMSEMDSVDSKDSCEFEATSNQLTSRLGLNAIPLTSFRKTTNCSSGWEENFPFNKNIWITEVSMQAVLGQSSSAESRYLKVVPNRLRFMVIPDRELLTQLIEDSFNPKKPIWHKALNNLFDPAKTFAIKEKFNGLSRSEAIDLIERQLKESNFTIGEDVFEKKVSEDIWFGFLNRNKIRPESGTFGIWHGYYSHMLQLIAMTDGMTTEEKKVFAKAFSDCAAERLCWRLLNNLIDNVNPQ